MIGGCPGASTASAAPMAGPQVRLGGGWNCDPSQTTSGDATADGADDRAAHPATTVAIIAMEITSLLMAPRTVRYPCRFPCARPLAARGRLGHLLTPGLYEFTGSYLWGGDYETWDIPITIDAC